MGKAIIRIIIFSIFIVYLLTPLCMCFAVRQNEDLFSNDSIIDFKDEYESQIRLKTLNVEYTGKGNLESVYVSQEGWFILVFSEGTHHHINIYNEACQFINRIVVNESGKLLAMFDESDHQIVLFPIRDHVLIKIDEGANYLSAWSIENNELSYLVNKLSALNDFKINVAGNTYSFKRNSIISKDSQVFSVTNVAGEEIFNYISDSYITTENHLLNGMLLLFVGFLISKKLLKNRKH